MAEKPQPRGFDVNQPGADRETGIGLFRGLTTDIPGGIVDFMSFITGGAKSAAESAPGNYAGKVVTGSPFLSSLALLDDPAKKLQSVAGSEALETKFFGKAPTEELQTIRDDAALVGSLVGLGEIATMKAANFVGRKISDVFKRADGQIVAVTPDGQQIFVPPEVVGDVPDTSVVENIGGALATSGEMRKRMLLDDIAHGVSKEDSYEQLGAEIDPAFAGDVDKGFRFQIQGIENAKLLPDHFQDFNNGRTGLDIGAPLYTPVFDRTGREIGVQTLGGSKTVTLSEILDYPELFYEYPFLENVEVGRMSDDILGGKAAAAYNVKEDGKGLILVKATDNLRDFQKSLLHEIQHAIQDYEPQMMVGSNPQDMTARYGPVSFLSEFEGEKTYYTVFGEAEARVVEDTFENPILLSIPPSQRRTKPRNDLTDRTVPLPDEELVMITDDLSDNALRAAIRSTDPLVTGGIGPFARFTNRRPVDVYHGTGTDFDVFDMSKVNTGEGAQMYGHGLYTSDLEEIGTHYRDNVGAVTDVVADPAVALEERAAGFSSMGLVDEYTEAGEALVQIDPEIVEIDGVPYFFVKETEENVNENFLFTELPDTVGPDKSYVNLSQGIFRYMYPDGTSVVTRSKNAAGEQFEHPETGEFGVVVEFMAPSQGKVMKVGMDIDPDTEMLDFHETLDRMDPFVQQRLKYVIDTIMREEPVGQNAILKPDLGMLRNVQKDLNRVIEKGKLSSVDGQGVLDSIARALGVTREHPEISQMLRFAGIRGTRYYTAGSRGRSLEPYERTYNYVVFDDRALDIKEKYREGGDVSSSDRAFELVADAINRTGRMPLFIKRVLDPKSPKTADNETMRLADSERDGRYYVYPTIFPTMTPDGPRLTSLDDDAAFNRAMDSGEFLVFDTEAEASTVARGFSGNIDPKGRPIDSGVAGFIPYMLQ